MLLLFIWGMPPPAAPGAWGPRGPPGAMRGSCAPPHPLAAALKRRKERFFLKEKSGTD